MKTSALSRILQFEQITDQSGRSPLTLSSLHSTSRWLVIAVGLVRAYLARGSYHGLYYSIEKPLKFFQTGAILEVRWAQRRCEDHLLHVTRLVCTVLIRLLIVASFFRASLIYMRSCRVLAGTVGNVDDPKQVQWVTCLTRILMFTASSNSKQILVCARGTIIQFRTTTGCSCNQLVQCMLHENKWGSVLCNKNASEWPFIVTSPRHACAIIVSFNQYLDASRPSGHETKLCSKSQIWIWCFHKKQLKSSKM